MADLISTSCSQVRDRSTPRISCSSTTAAARLSINCRCRTPRSGEVMSLLPFPGGIIPGRAAFLVTNGRLNACRSGAADHLLCRSLNDGVNRASRLQLTWSVRSPCRAAGCRRSRRGCSSSCSAETRSTGGIRLRGCCRGSWLMSPATRAGRRPRRSPRPHCRLGRLRATQVPIIGLVSRWTWSKRPPLGSARAMIPNQHGLHRPRVMTPGSGSELTATLARRGFHNLLG